MIAPATAAAITAHSGAVPREAATPPKMTAISPGKTKPTNAEAFSGGKANTSARTSPPGSDKMRSVTLETRPAVATAAHPGRDIRSRRVAAAAPATVAGEVVIAIRSPSGLGIVMRWAGAHGHRPGDGGCAGAVARGGRAGADQE
jgi:hypothetical protein